MCKYAQLQEEKLGIKIIAKLKGMLECLRGHASENIQYIWERKDL